MENEHNNDQKIGFGHIFKSLLFSQEHLDKLAAENPEGDTTESNTVSQAKTQAQPVANYTVPSATSTVLSANSGTDVEEMKKKIYGLIEKNNQPGIDFLEVWNAAAAMEGGITQSNIQHAFVALNIGSGNILTVDGLVSSAEQYIKVISSEMNDAMNKKAKEKIQLVNNQNNERLSHSDEITRLNGEIREAQQKLALEEQALQQLDNKYVGPIAAIDKKIQAGDTALKAVIKQIQDVVVKVKMIKK